MKDKQMSHKISKELFEAVMGFKIVMPPIIEVDNTVIGYLVYGRQDTPEQVHQNHRRIPINDFFFMCKEWAFSKGYMQMLSGIRDNKIGYCFSDRFNHHYYYEAPTEQQAVFDACQWILDKDRQ